jgi:hypothetical protein
MSGLVERLEEAVRLVEVGEYLYDAKSYSHGDGYSEPREYGIEWHWQQSQPNEYGQGVLLAEANRWHDEMLADSEMQTEARKLRTTIAEAADYITRLEADNARLREAYAEACDAADLIMVRVTAEIGRYVIEASEEDTVPMLAETGVQITAAYWRRLYASTSRAALQSEDQST